MAHDKLCKHKWPTQSAQLFFLFRPTKILVSRHRIWGINKYKQPPYSYGDGKVMSLEGGEGKNKNGPALKGLKGFLSFWTVLYSKHGQIPLICCSDTYDVLVVRVLPPEPPIC